MTSSALECGVELGRGSEAVVYLRRCGEVAMKLFRKPSRACSELSFIEMNLDHARIVRVLAQDVKAGWLAMECIKGYSLAEVIQRNGQLGEKHLVSILADVLDGLTVFHAHNMPHRDLKPSNVMQEWASGRCKIIDWIGQAAEEHSVALGKPVGSPLFMAPEVTRPPHRHCLASDSWALGCTVVNLASGRLPWAEADFYGHTNELMAMWRTAHGDFPPHDASTWTWELRQFMSLCFESDPQNRALAVELRAQPVFVYSGHDSCSQASV